MSFGKPKEDNTSPSGPSSGPRSSTTRNVEAFLGQGSKVVGNLTFSGPVELDGYVEGEISSQARLEVGESAVIKAKVVGTEVIIRGTIEGDIEASERLVLLKPAKIVGNITSNNLSIEEGVIFEGTCTMRGGGTRMGTTNPKHGDQKHNSQKQGASATV